MVLKWLQYFTFVSVLAYPTVCLSHNDPYKSTNPNDWRVIEMLAEEHPYIVALLNAMKDYICTGSIINKQCIITSGNCIAKDPKYVAVSTAVYSKRVNNNTIFNVASTLVHGDYVYELHTADLNVTRMHSNIGLVFVDRPFLEVFINVAELGNSFASELQNKKIAAIGYGGLGPGNLIGLQYQSYQQTPCVNPKWYYCVCGVEHNAMTTTHITEFGAGGPALLNSLLVGISAAPCGSLSMRNLGVKYNVFTVVGPYSAWIEKWTSNWTTTEITFRSSNRADVERSTIMAPLFILIMISKIFF